MNVKDLYLIKGNFNYDGIDYNFDTLQLVRIKDINKFTPLDIKYFSKFDITQNYIYDEINNNMLPLNTPINLTGNNMLIFTSYSNKPIMLLGQSTNSAFTYINIYSKNVISISSNNLENNVIILALYKKTITIMKGSTTFGDMGTISSNFNFVFKINQVQKLKNDLQIFDWDIIEL